MNRIKYLGLAMLLVIGSFSVSAQEVEGNTVITLERTACFGTCPVYSIKILEDGTVIYEGDRSVTTTGQQIGEIAPDIVVLMTAAFEDAGYFGWNEAYETQTVSDLPTVITSVKSANGTHRIARYIGDSTAPLALSFLEQWIDEMTNSALWTGIQPDSSTISNGTDTPIITLQHGANFGTGPVYSIAAYKDGTVVYTGDANVNVIGVQVIEGDSSTIASIAQTAQNLGFFDWQDSYEERVITDQATVVTSIRWEDQFKRIARYAGDPNAPVGVVRIEESIARLVTEFVG